MSKNKAPRVWFYRPVRHWYGWKSLRPVWFGNDEWHRKTLVLGWNPTGQVVIALWHFRNCTEDCGPFCDECGLRLDTESRGIRQNDLCTECEIEYYAH